MKIQESPEALAVINSYTPIVTEKLLFLRDIIILAAKEADGVNSLEEALKWGEPAYLTRYGSTVRIDWKEKSPAQYALYFKCTSKLVPTFKKLYPEKFSYEKNRAIVFQLDDEIPLEELKHCVQLALSYHRVKHLDLLGAEL